MRLISHRGNLNGPNPERENTPDYISEALRSGFEVEIDVWHTSPDRWFLGHNAPVHEIDRLFLMQSGLVIHCKNLYALHNLVSNHGIECFFHDRDPFTLTSKNNIWTYPGQPVTSRSILVHPESIGTWPNDIAGVCSDWISRYERFRNV